MKCFLSIAKVLRFGFIILNLDLRKQARQLENDIDAKLVNFSKLGSGPTPFNSASKSNG